MAETLKRLVGPQLLNTTGGTVYTVPANTQAVLRDIIICNESGSAATFTISIGTDGAGKRLFKSSSLAANTTFQQTGNITLEAAEVIQAVASANSAIVLTISGLEIT